MLAGSTDTYRGGLPIVHSQMLFYGLVDFTSTLEHAGRCPTHHHMVLAHLTSVEHGVKGGNLIYPNRWHIQNFRHLQEILIVAMSEQDYSMNAAYGRELPSARCSVPYSWHSG